MQTLFDILLLQGGYNTSLVMLAAASLGAVCGTVGTFALLRKRALVSDGMSHATLPGIALAFLLGHMLSGEGRSFWLLMAGAGLSSALGLWCIGLLTRHTRLDEDAAIGVVLSSFFGLGVVLLTVVQATNYAGQAGLSGYLLGSTSGMIRSEAEAIAAISLAGVAVTALALKSFTAIGFDAAHAFTAGLPVRAMDALLMGLVLVIICVGIKATGLILVIALLITPAVTARYWTETAPAMALLAGLTGAAGAYLGAALSAVAPALPTGALIVLTQFALLLFSMAAAPKHGLFAARLRRERVKRKLGLTAEPPHG
jgi:manganese/zinc/iron transport system permease protein